MTLWTKGSYCPWGPGTHQGMSGSVLGWCHRKDDGGSGKNKMGEQRKKGVEEAS